MAGVNETRTLVYIGERERNELMVGWLGTLMMGWGVGDKLLY